MKQKKRHDWLASLPDGVPCDHPGCLAHMSHPCEVCGRIGGQRKTSPNGVYISLPWPPRTLSPNARAHWARKYTDADKLKTAGYYLALEKGVKLDRAKRYDLTLTFCPPTNRVRDEDNLIASMKAAIDGMCRGLGIDDSQLHIIPDMGPVVKGGKVEACIVESKPFIKDAAIELIKKRILYAGEKKNSERINEWTEIEWDAFWDGQLRCAQDLMNEISKL